MLTKPRYVVAIYAADRLFGGPEEGGWWHDAGDLDRVVRVFPSEEKAAAFCRRLNHWLEVLASHLKYDVGSVLYAGGQYIAEVFEGTAPAVLDPVKPQYE